MAFLKRNEDALMAYMEAFDHDPQNEQVKQAIRDLKSKMTGLSSFVIICDILLMLQILTAIKVLKYKLINQSHAYFQVICFVWSTDME